MQLFRRCSRFFKSSIKSHRIKFDLDYIYYKELPRQDRNEELARIVSTPRSPLQFKKQIPTFPKEEIWEYHSIPLMTYFWEPNSKPKGIVVFFHSLNGHTNICGEMAKSLVSKGLIIAGYDYKNFGKSGGENRGLIEDFDSIVETSEQFIIRVKAKYPGLRVFLVGMSMGGSVLFHLSHKRPNISNGNIFINAAISSNKMHIPIIKKVVLFLGLITPKVKLLKSGGRYGSKYSLSKFSSSDPYLYRGRAWVQTLSTMMTISSRCRHQFKSYSAPFLAVQGGLDKLIDPFAAIDLQNQCKSKDKTVVMIADMWHAVWFDDRLGDVTRVVQEWIQDRL